MPGKQHGNLDAISRWPEKWLLETEKLQQQDQRATKRARDISEDCSPFIGALKDEQKGEHNEVGEEERLKQEMDSPELSPTTPITVHHLTDVESAKYEEISEKETAELYEHMQQVKRQFLENRNAEKPTPKKALVLALLFEGLESSGPSNLLNNRTRKSPGK